MNESLLISQLAEIISNTPEFIEYKNIKKQVSLDKNASSLLKQFEDKQRQLQSPQIKPEKAQKIMEELNKDYQTLNKNPLIVKYFEAEDKFKQVFQTVVQNIYSELKKKM